jgi:hypothetical protein
MCLKQIIQDIFCEPTYLPARAPCNDRSIGNTADGGKRAANLNEFVGLGRIGKSDKAFNACTLYLTDWSVLPSTLSKGTLPDMKFKQSLLKGVANAL